MKNHLYNTLYKLLVKNNIKVHKEELKLQISSHPSYPSLHAVTGVLSHFNIDNIALRVPTNKETLKRLPKQFLAVISSEEMESIVLIEKNKSTYKVSQEYGEVEIMSSEKFLTKWNGIVVAIEKDENINKKRSFEPNTISKAILLISLVIGIAFFTITFINLFIIFHFTLSLIGLILSVLIVKHELGLQSGTTNKLCNLFEKTSCDVVLNSNGAKLFDFLKLSDLSITSFSGFTVASIILIVTGLDIYSILLLSILALPFLIYSIYYQYAVVKKWCPLCLGIGSVLFFQIIVSIFIISQEKIIVTLPAILTLLVVFIIAFSSWSLLKQFIKNKLDLFIIKVDHNKFKRNYTLFKASLNDEVLLSDLKDIPNEIILGNQESNVTLTLVTSPLCYFCKDAHKNVTALLEKAGEKFKIRLRFMADYEDKSSLLYRITHALLEAYQNKNEQKIHKMLDEVYSKDFDATIWLENKSSNISSILDTVIKNQKDWCLLNGISFTPALYVNDRLFPKMYEHKDVLLFLDELQEETTTIKHTTKNIKAS